MLESALRIKITCIRISVHADSLRTVYLEGIGYDSNSVQAVSNMIVELGHGIRQLVGSRSLGVGLELN